MEQVRESEVRLCAYILQQYEATYATKMGFLALASGLEHFEQL